MPKLQSLREFYRCWKEHSTDSQQIAEILEREFPVKIEWIGDKSFIIVFHPEVSFPVAEEMQTKISTRMRQLMSM